MQYWLNYVNAAYEVIMIAEDRASIVLEHEVEAYLVHTFARYMEQPNIPTDSIAIKMMTAINENGVKRKKQLEQIAEECILIDGLELNSRRWPNKTYFKDMGKLALEHRAYSSRPVEKFFEKVASQFNIISNILHNIKV